MATRAWIRCTAELLRLTRCPPNSKCKLKERVILTILSACTFLTIVLVLNVQIATVREARLHRVSQNSGQLVGELRRPESSKEGIAFRKRVLQKTINGSREASSAADKTAAADATAIGSRTPSRSGAGAGEPALQPPAPHDNYSDIAELVAKADTLFGEWRDGRFVYRKHRRKLYNPSIAETAGLRPRNQSSSFERFHLSISREQMYGGEDPTIPELLNDMATEPIVHLEQQEGGTQLKLIIDFASGGQALFKPMRFSREQETLPNHFYFTDFERHNAEIAAFHLDRVLGFRRSPPVVGRMLNMTTELYALAKGELLKTFFISPANNLCFHGRCSYYCDTSHAICGSPDTLEGSFAVFLPPKSVAPRRSWRHPWRRSYHKRKKASWEWDQEYCDMIKELPPYNTGRRLLDVIDLSMFDFLMGNMDRHHYETFSVFGTNETFPVHLDHGRAFGKAKHDEFSILAPLYQCCMIRQSTAKMFLRFHNGEKKLSDVMRESLAKDPIAPILTEAHLTALDRRVGVIMQVVRDCVNQVEANNVVVLNDGL